MTPKEFINGFHQQHPFDYKDMQPYSHPIQIFRLHFKRYTNKLTKNIRVT